FEIFGARSRFTAKADVQVLRSFPDKAPAFTLRTVGKGQAYYCGFLPALSYFKRAIPLRPVDRGSTDDTMPHFIPTKLNEAAAEMLASPAVELLKPVECSEPLVENTVIESKHGVVIPLINWSAGPVKGLTVRVTVNVPTNKVELASGKPVRMSKNGNTTVFTLDMDLADALILR